MEVDYDDGPLPPQPSPSPYDDIPPPRQSADIDAMFAEIDNNEYAFGMENTPAAAVLPPAVAAVGVGANAAAAAAAAAGAQEHTWVDAIPMTDVEQIIRDKRRQMARSRSQSVFDMGRIGDGGGDFMYQRGHSVEGGRRLARRSVSAGGGAEGERARGYPGAAAGHCWLCTHGSAGAGDRYSRLLELIYSMVGRMTPIEIAIAGARYHEEEIAKRAAEEGGEVRPITPADIVYHLHVCDISAVSIIDEQSRMCREILRTLMNDLRTCNDTRIRMQIVNTYMKVQKSLMKDVLGSDPKKMAFHSNERGGAGGGGAGGAGGAIGADAGDEADMTLDLVIK